MREPQSPTSTGTPLRVTRKPPSVVIATGGGRRGRLGGEATDVGEVAPCPGVVQEPLGRGHEIGARRAGPGFGDQQQCPGLADRVAELVPEATRLLGPAHRRWILAGGQQQQRFGDGRAVELGVGMLERRFGVALGGRAVASVERDPAGGAVGLGPPEWLPDRDRPFGGGRGGRQVVVDQHPGHPTSAGTRPCTSPHCSASSIAACEQRPGLGLLPAQVLNVAEVGEGVGDVVGLQPLPDPLGLAKVA